MGEGSVDLYWIPLGAGGHVVAFNGRVYEALAAGLQRRRRLDLYHAALELREGSRRWVVEMTPAWSETAPDRGVVREGSVGSRVLGRSRFFRYEVRCWEDGRIPDVSYAVGGAQRVSDDGAAAAQIRRTATEVPALVWGRDELGTGDMWNSNSLIAWLLARSLGDVRYVGPPPGGRAPGWQAGIALAERQTAAPRSS